MAGLSANQDGEKKSVQLKKRKAQMKDLISEILGVSE